MRLVLANGSLAGYPEGGGHWSVFLQYLFGLCALGHDVFWLELLACDDRGAGERRATGFLRRLRRYGFGGRSAVLAYPRGLAPPTLGSVTVYGTTIQRIRELANEADLLWNFCCALRQPLLSLFSHRVLVDLDPGHLHVSALTWNMDIHDHHAFLTVGGKLGSPDCEVPTLGETWRPFLPSVHLPMWKAAGDPGLSAPFTSVTQWGWGELWWRDRVLSVSKRDAYLKYVDLPRQAGRAFELAANLDPDDETGDRELLQKHGWTLVHPHRVARTPAGYRRYIRRSRAELCCPKPVHIALRSGWFSDRSAAYLATGRPVLVEDTGIRDHLPTGDGLLAFRDAEEAVAGVADIDARYAHHMRAARDFAEAYLDSRRCLDAMLAASFSG